MHVKINECTYIKNLNHPQAKFLLENMYRLCCVKFLCEVLKIFRYTHWLCNLQLYLHRCGTLTRRSLEYNNVLEIYIFLLFAFEIIFLLVSNMYTYIGWEAL